MNTAQKTALLVGLATAALLLILHNPSQGYYYFCDHVVDINERMNECERGSVSYFAAWHSQRPAFVANFFGLASFAVFLMAEAATLALTALSLWLFSSKPTQH